MKFLSLLLFVLITPAMAAKMTISNIEIPTKIVIAYPIKGTAIGGQIGLILEKTDILKIYGFNPTIKRMKTDKELQTAILKNGADVLITTESNYVAMTEINAKVQAISTLGLEKDFQLVNVIHKDFSAKNPKAVEKLNGAFIDAFYYLINHKAEVNKWYADLAKSTPKAVDSASLLNKNYGAKKLSEIDIKIP